MFSCTSEYDESWSKNKAAVLKVHLVEQIRVGLRAIFVSSAPAWPAAGHFDVFTPVVADHGCTSKWDGRHDLSLDWSEERKMNNLQERK